MLIVRVEGTSGPVLVTEAGENEKVPVTTPTHPAPAVVAESAAVQLLLFPLNWMVSGKVTEPPARPELGLCAPKSTLFGCPSVKVVCACRPLVWPLAVNTNRT